MNDSSISGKQAQERGWKSESLAKMFSVVGEKGEDMYFHTSISLSPLTTSRCKPGGGLPALKNKSEKGIFRMFINAIYNYCPIQHCSSPTSL